MLVTMDLTLSLDAELANLLADYDAFLAAEDGPIEDGFDDTFDDEGEDDVTDETGADDGGIDDSGDDEVTDETGGDPAVGEDATGEAPTAEDPPVDGEPVDQGGVDDSEDPADVSEEVEPDLGPQVDFGLISDELAFDLNEALMVGRTLGSEFFDFA